MTTRAFIILLGVSMIVFITIIIVAKPIGNFFVNVYLKDAISKAVDAEFSKREIEKKSTEEITTEIKTAREATTPNGPPPKFSTHPSKSSRRSTSGESSQ